MDDQLLEITMTARALGCAGVEIERAMRRAVQAHRDERFGKLLDARRAELRAHLGRAAVELSARATRAGIHRGRLEDLPELVARVEIVRELLGPPDHIEALGTHPSEVS